MSLVLSAVLLLVNAAYPLPSSGELTYPTGSAPAGVIELRVVDRNRLPLEGARVTGVFEGTGGAQLMTAENGSAALVPLESVTTGRDGRTCLRAPVGGWCGLSVERSGFAPGRFLPLFAGHSYELLLDFGASVTVICQDPQGAGVEAELVIEQRTFPALPRGVAPRRRMTTGPEGIACIDGLPVGSTVIQARAANGARGRLDLSVGSAWRHNALFFEGTRVLTLYPTRERFLRVTDTEGRPIEGVRAIVVGDLPEGWVSAEAEAGGLRVRGLLDAPPECERLSRTLSLRVLARGWRTLSLSMVDDSPPSAWTEPVALLAALASPAAPVAGRLWTALDPFGPSPWESVEVSQGAAPGLEPFEGLAIVGGLVAHGRVAAWLQAEADAQGTQLEWLEPATLQVRMSVDGEPYHLGLVSFELCQPAIGGAVPNSLGQKRWTYADPDGVCELHGLLPGRWRVALSTSYINTQAAEAFVDVGPGETRQVEIDATRGVTLPGRVIDSGGTPLAGGRVTVYGTDRQTVADGSFPVAEDGSFSITGLVPGAGYLILWEERPPPNTVLSEPQLARLAVRTGRTAQVKLPPVLPESITIAAEASPPAASAPGRATEDQ